MKILLTVIMVGSALTASTAMLADGDSMQPSATSTGVLPAHDAHMMQQSQISASKQIIHCCMAHLQSPYFDKEVMSVAVKYQELHPLVRNVLVRELRSKSFQSLYSSSDAIELAISHPELGLVEDAKRSLQADLNTLHARCVAANGMNPNDTSAFSPFDGRIIELADKYLKA